MLMVCQEVRRNDTRRMLASTLPPSAAAAAAAGMRMNPLTASTQRVQAYSAGLTVTDSSEPGSGCKTDRQTGQTRQTRGRCQGCTSVSWTGTECTISFYARIQRWIDSHGQFGALVVYTWLAITSASVVIVLMLVRYRREV